MTNNDTRPVIGVALNLTDDGRQAYPLPATRANLSDLTDLALARYAAQWSGTPRGVAAVAEITRRGPEDDTPDVFDALAYPAGYTRCRCDGCRDLAARDQALRAPVRVRETIQHGDYVSRLTVGGSTLSEAVASSLGVSPYNYAGAAHVAGGDLAARIVAELSATGHAEFGWADYDVVA